MARAHGWEWVLKSLWVEGDPRRCRISIPDTVLVTRGSADAPLSRWLFTSKSGVVAKKRDDNLTVHKLTRKLLANDADVVRAGPRRMCTCAGRACTCSDVWLTTLARALHGCLLWQVLAYSSGSSEAHELTPVAFDKLMNRVMSGTGGSVCALQAHVPGTKYAVDFQRGAAPGKETWNVSRVMDNGSTVASRAAKVNESLAEAASLRDG